MFTSLQSDAPRKHRALRFGSCLAFAIALASCSSDETPTVEDAKEAASEAGERVTEAAEQAQSQVVEAASEAKQKTAQAAERVEAVAESGADRAGDAMAAAREEIKEEMAELRLEADEMAADAAEPLESVDETPDVATADGRAPQQHVVTARVTNFDPMILFVQPGDSVVWQNMAGHNVDSIEGMIPEGATPFQSKLGEEGYAVTFDIPGAYVYKCTPHVSTGMVAAVVVGDSPANIEAIDAALPEVKIARNMVGRAIRKMKKAIDER